jgi:hypothetical protein
LENSRDAGTDRDVAEAGLDEQIFTDGLGAITVVGGTVRLDLVAYSPTEKDPRGQPLLVFRQRVVMGTEGFLLMSEKIREVASALAKAGNRPRLEPVPVEPAKKVPPAAEPVAASAATPAAAMPSGRPFP